MLLSALFEMLSHTVILAAFLIVSRILEFLIYFLWGNEGRLLFDFFQLRWIFDAADLGALIGFLVFGTYRLFRVYFT